MSHHLSFLCWLAVVLLIVGAVCMWLWRRARRLEVILSSLHPDVFVGVADQDGIYHEAWHHLSLTAMHNLRSISGRPIWDSAWLREPGRQSAELREQFAQALSTQGENRMEVELRTQSGDAMHVDLTMRAIGRGPHMEIVVSGVDASDALNTRRSLRHNRETLGRLVQRSADAIIEWDAELIIVRWSPVAQRIFCIRPEEALGQAVDEVLPFLEIVMPGRAARNATRLLQHQCPDGVLRKLEVSIQHYPDQAGDWSALAQIRDLTELEQAQARIEAAELRIVQWLGVETVGLGSLSHDGLWLECGRGLARLFPEDLTPSEGSCLFEQVHAEDVSALQAALEALRQNPGTGRELTLRRPDGIELRAALNSLPGDEGFPARVQIVIADAAEGQGLRKQIRELHDQIVAVDTRRRAEIEALVSNHKRQTRDLQHINEMITLLATVQDTSEAALVVVRCLSKLFPGTAGALYFGQDEHSRMVQAQHWGELDDCADNFSQGDCWGLRRVEVHRVDRPGETLQCAHFDTVCGETSRLCQPLQVPEGVVGLLVMEWPYDDVDAAPDPLLLRTIGEQVALGISNLRLRDELRRQAFFDPLTGLSNRRRFDDLYDREWRRAIRSGERLSVLMIDVDHFKAYNDRYGHPAGDLCLTRVAAAINESIRRPPDLGVRYGGEEFLVLLPSTDLMGARFVAERIASAVRMSEIPHESSPIGKLTLSVGVASCLPDRNGNRDELTRAADRALYLAKLTRNAVCDLSALDEDGEGDETED